MGHPSELIDLLRTDVGAWNRWRRGIEREALRLLAAIPADVRGPGVVSSPEFKRFAGVVALDLQGVDLTGAALQRANLGMFRRVLHALRKLGLGDGYLDEVPAGTVVLDNARLEGADLRGADLRRTQLRGAKLQHADLRKAKLARASLDDADLVGARLEGADLSGASLKRASLAGPEWLAFDTKDTAEDGRLAGPYAAHLHGAILAGVDLTGARLNALDLRGIDLRPAKSLRDVKLVRADLRDHQLGGADLRGADLRRADLTGADLTRATFNTRVNIALNTPGRRKVVDSTHRRRASPRVLGQAFAEAGPPADLEGAILQGANLSGVDLRGMSLRGTDLRGATLAEAALAGADLTDKDLHAVDLTDADLTCAVLLGTDLTDAVLTGCRIHGVAAWDVKLSGAQQDSLVISAPDDAVITADGLEVGQFIYLLLKNAKLREVIDAVTAKAVLILGRFTEERMRVLNAMGDALRSRNLLPIIFDFEAPKHRDVKDTVQTLAHLSRFIIADLTDPRSVPQELATIVPLLPSVPVQPVIQEDQEPWSMFPTLRRYPWVLEPFRYASAANLVAALDAHVLAPAEAAVQQGRPER